MPKPPIELNESNDVLTSSCAFSYSWAACSCATSACASSCCVSTSLYLVLTPFISLVNKSVFPFALSSSTCASVSDKSGILDFKSKINSSSSLISSMV